MYQQSSPPLRRAKACEYLAARWGVIRDPKTLAKYAVVGGGPRFRKDGKFPVYPTDELDAWAQAKLSPLRSSTSDTGA
jgi:hypothetical protein